eukprot:14487389-Ditylum_brightwellii.AAC.1
MVPIVQGPQHKESYSGPTQNSANPIRTISSYANTLRGRVNNKTFDNSDNLPPEQPRKKITIQLDNDFPMP